MCHVYSVDDLLSSVPCVKKEHCVFIAENSVVHMEKRCDSLTVPGNEERHSTVTEEKSSYQV